MTVPKTTRPWVLGSRVAGTVGASLGSNLRALRWQPFDQTGAASQLALQAGARGTLRLLLGLTRPITRL